ncbi:hypothetical protein D3C80_2169650 [compost metagenome]
MAWAVLDVGNQAAVRRSGCIWAEFVEQVAEGVHNLDVLLLVVATDVVGLADLTFDDDLV